MERLYAFKPRPYAAELFWYDVAVWIILAVFLVGAARMRGERPSLLAFVPGLQYFDLARKLETPAIVGILLAAGFFAVKTTDYFYGMISVVRFASCFVLVPAWLWLWHRLTRVYGQPSWVFWLLFAPFITAPLGYLYVGLCGLTGRRVMAHAGA